MRKGFTLIELLIVIAIIAVLAGVAFVALNPLQRFQDARDATRWSDVTAVLDAAKVDQVDNGGAYLEDGAGLEINDLTNGLFYTIGTCAAGGDDGCTAQPVTQAACADVTGLATEGYISAIPQDPSTGSAAETDYYITKSALGVLTIGACDPEGRDAISLSR